MTPSDVPLALHKHRNLNRQEPSFPYLVSSVGLKTSMTGRVTLTTESWQCTTCHSHFLRKVTVELLSDPHTPPNQCRQ